MKFMLINPPHPAIGSRIPREHLPPLGLLALGGPLLDTGHQVKLLDAEFEPMTVDQIVAETKRYGPDAVLLGHSGSTSGHPVASRIAQALRTSFPRAWTVYGGVFPTYHWPEIMEQEPAIDFIVRGEGEETVVHLATALEQRQALERVPGIVFRTNAAPGQRRPATGWPPDGGQAVANPQAPLIRDLDACRIGWELIDHSRYTYYGNGRAVVAQFSRGCPYHCHYCGQHGFWGAWRHRDPVRFAAELARLHREHGVEVINLADENPTASRPAWRAFLEALISHQVLESAHVPNWRVVLWVKLIEAVCQLRPRSLFRLLMHPDQSFRAGMRWYSNIGRRVWTHEIWHWLFFDQRTRHGPTLAQFLRGGWS